jgi:hypothetical protein
MHMSGLNEKTTEQTDTIVAKSDEIIARLNDVALNTANAPDQNQALIGAIQDVQNVMLDVANRVQAGNEILNTSLFQQQQILSILTTLVSETIVARQANELRLDELISIQGNIRALTADFIAPQLEGIFFATNGTIDAVLASACLCAPDGSPLLLPPTGSTTINNLHCQRVQAWLDLLIDNVQQLLSTVRQGGRITSAAASTLFIISLTGVTTPITVPATIVTSVLSILGVTAEFKLQQLLDWLNDNSITLRQALFNTPSAGTAQDEWYAVVDASNDEALPLDMKVLTKLLVWSGSIEVLYSTDDIGQDAYDGTVCAPPPPNYTTVPAIQVARIRKVVFNDPNSLWQYDNYNGFGYPLSIDYGILSPVESNNNIRFVEYNPSVGLPPDGSPLQDYPISVRLLWNRPVNRIRFRIPDGQPSGVELQRYNVSMPLGTITPDNGWLEAPDEATYQSYFVYDRPGSGHPDAVHYQVWTGASWASMD